MNQIRNREQLFTSVKNTKHLNIPIHKIIIPKLIILKMAKKQGKQLECIRCGYKWTPMSENPSVCPKCKSYAWNIPRIRAKKDNMWDEEVTCFKCKKELKRKDSKYGYNHYFHKQCYKIFDEKAGKEVDKIMKKAEEKKII